MDRDIVSDRHANCFFFIAVLVLMLNFLSQNVAFPFQMILLIYAVFKSNVKLLPGLFVVLLDKSCFPDFGASLLKYRIGIVVGLENLFLIAVFIVVVFRIVMNRYKTHSLFCILLFWISTIIPAWVISNQSRSDGLAVWQEPFVSFLTPALFFWGWSVGRTWKSSREYFIKCMSFLLLMLNFLSLGKHYYVFSFVRPPLSLGLAIGAILSRCSSSCRFLSLGACVTGMLDMIFGRYLRIKDKMGYADAAELGSTFTTVMTAVFCCMIIGAVRFSAQRKQGVRFLPVLFLLPLCCVFFYAVSRAQTKGTDIGGSNYRNVIERFEFKLIGDRGRVWADGLQDIWVRPLFFKRYIKRLVSAISPTGERIVVLKMPPHNQILTLLAIQGWWLGLFCIIFLLWTHFRMFSKMTYMLDDKIMICVLLAPSAAVFYSVGLTGQSVWNAVFTGNSLVTLIFPGVICGAWQSRQEGNQNQERWGRCVYCG